MPAPVGQVLDRDLAQRPLLEQPFGGGEDRALALVAAGAGGAAAARRAPRKRVGESVICLTIHGVDDSRQEVDSLDTVLIALLADGDCSSRR